MSLDLYIPTLLEVLTKYKPFDDLEAYHRERMIHFINTSVAPFSRRTAAGHVTASAILTDQSISHVLLIWHSKLHRWLQPGGHCEEDADSTTQGAALRELLEETDIDSTVVRPMRDEPIDIDIHLIPASGSEGEHLHYDLRYAFTIERILDSPSRHWKSVSEIMMLEDESMVRFSRKLSRATG